MSLPDLPGFRWLRRSRFPHWPPNQSCQIALALTPATNLVLGPYSGELQVAGTNATASVPFNFTAVSSLTGNLQVTAEDELTLFGAGNPNLSNTTVAVNNYYSGATVASQVTGSDGIVTFNNLNSAYYTVTAVAPDHGTFSTTLLLPSGQTHAADRVSPSATG